MLGVIPYRYVRFALLPPREQEPVWHYEQWCSKVEPVLDGMLQTVGYPCSIHTRQGPTAKMQNAKLGRLVWNDKSHQKWTWGSPVTAGERDEWDFEDFELFAPPRHELLKGVSAMPTLYFQIQSMGWSPESDYEWVDDVCANYHQALLVLIRSRAFRKHKTRFTNLVTQLSFNLMQAPVYTATRGVWGLNNFESIFREELIYFGMHKDELPDLSKTKKHWNRIR